MQKFLNIYKAFNVGTAFYYMTGAAIFCMASSYLYAPALHLGFVLLSLSIAGVAYESYLLFSEKDPISVKRTMAKTLSLSDENIIHLDFINQSSFDWTIKVIEELPFQIQQRDFSLHIELKAKEKLNLKYTIQPNIRGSYEFGKTHLLVDAPWNLVRRIITIENDCQVAVYPSYLQMKKYGLMAFSSLATEGIKKIRRIGTNAEFEHIRSYVQGDDIRTINWKATSRRNELMVNQYEDEKAQQIYFAIDTSRSMMMPFNKLSLLDYAINTSLSLANIALKKYDKIGLVTFNKAIQSTLKASNKSGQLKIFNEHLYRLEQSKGEANFDLLLRTSRNLIKGRSLIFLYSNFESSYALERALPMLQRLNKNHLLVVVFFRNTEVEKATNEDPQTISQVFEHTIARDYLLEKELMLSTLRKLGIQSFLTTPEQLSVDSINKYLELKARGLL